VIAPDTAELPVPVNAPVPPTPLPLSVSASAVVTPPSTLSVAPLATVVSLPAPVAPSAPHSRF
jgi:hypothetical protein